MSHTIDPSLIRDGTKLLQRPVTNEELLNQLEKFRVAGVVGTPETLADEVDIELALLGAPERGETICGFMERGKYHSPSMIPPGAGDVIYLINHHPLSRFPTWNELYTCFDRSERWSPNYAKQVDKTRMQRSANIMNSAYYCIMREIDNPTWPLPRDFIWEDFDLVRELQKWYVRGASWDDHRGRFIKWANRRKPKEKYKFDYHHDTRGQ